MGSRQWGMGKAENICRVLWPGSWGHASRTLQRDCAGPTEAWLIQAGEEAEMSASARRGRPRDATQRSVCACVRPRRICDVWSRRRVRSKGHLTRIIWARAVRNREPPQKAVEGPQVCSIKHLNGANWENRANLRNVWKHAVVVADAGGEMRWRGCQTVQPSSLRHPGEKHGLRV